MPHVTFRETALPRPKSEMSELEKKQAAQPVNDEYFLKFQDVGSLLLSVGEGGETGFGGFLVRGEDSSEPEPPAYSYYGRSKT